MLRLLPGRTYLLIWILLILPVMVSAQEKCSEDWMARIESVQGTVLVQRAGQVKWVEAGLGDTICRGDKLSVPAKSRAAIFLRTGSVVRLDQNTAINMVAVENGSRSVLDILSGIALFFSRNPFSLKLNTPFVNAETEGTEFLVKVEGARASVTVFEGKVRASNQNGIISVGKGQTAISEAGGPPAVRTTVRPKDAVQWAVYYPPVPEIAENAVLAAGLNTWQGAVSASVQSYMKGDLAGAFSALREVPEIGEPALHTYRALLLLAVGRVDEASAELDRSLALNPNESSPVALQSIIAVAQNRKDRALELARRAIELDPVSSAALISLSYAQQARFDLEGALDSTKKAVGSNPHDAYAWARLSELQLSFGYLDKALDAAQQAVVRNPAIARTQTALGFAYLTQINIEESKKAFKKAIRLDQADPLPRLGLGLAMIREGDLAEGRWQIEIAAILDPENSLIRSYLGKAYFEEKRTKAASEQFRMAKELDPLDPTPWFYDAIQKQTINQPVEALGDIQKSMELNNNRAVYRSRLMLDQDLAARSVDLARIYEDLGFERLALTEGWKSLNVDPANFSAHRFLADSYFAAPRHEIARVSELLQSQLLQPINIMPIQPQLAETQHFLISGPGPGNPSYNEYTPLFVRNQLSLLVDGVAGQRGTVGDDVVHSGVVGPFSYSLGQFHFQTDGFRQFDDRQNDIYDGFAQLSVSPKTSIQAEFRHNESEVGDITQLFLTPSWNQRESESRDMMRLGFHHTFAPGYDLIGSFMYLDSNFKMRNPDYNENTVHNGYGFEAQHIYRSQHFNLIVGAGHFNQDINDLAFSSDWSSPRQLTTEHTNAYAYSYLNFPENVTWTVGLSGDFLEGGFLNLSAQQVNPKFGVTWTPFPGTTLRGAIFRTLKRTLLTNQTIEPTQVAGFNQLFDDGEGTDAWRYGIGLDQKLSDHLFVGGEFSWRDLDIPSTSTEPPFNTILTGAHENLGRAYLYWIPHLWFAIGPEYQYEWLRNDQMPFNGVMELDTHRFGFNIGFYHPSGFLARLRPMYVLQNGDFRSLPWDPTTSADSNFFALDASIGYRLPRRLGLIELVARNLFDESFRFQDTDPRNPSVAYQRVIFGRWTLSF